MSNDVVFPKASKNNTRGRGESIRKTERPSVGFQDLPLDVLYTIVSKLPPKEFARASVLSSKWRCLWSVCPRLTFDGVTLCKCSSDDLHQHIGTFIREVNAVLQKHSGKVVETLEVRIDFVDSQLVHHLNNWIRFAVASRTKSITLDLKPESSCWDEKDRYVFPFQLLDVGTTSRLRNMQLSFVSLKLPAGFRGFPNLTKLHIQLPHVSRKDLEHMLSRCYNLEWLHIDRCDLNDELVVGLPHLLYLRVEHGKFTKIKFHAVNLLTFEYRGSFTPVDLSHSLKLQNVKIELFGAVFQHVLKSLLNGLQNVQNLTLFLGLLDLEKQWLWDNPLKFSYLRNLQLSMIVYYKDVDKILYSVSFMRVIPFIERLNLRLAGCFWLADVGPLRHEMEHAIGQCKYNYLKKLYVSDFQAARWQLEFILHIVENAPALEVVTVQLSKRFYSHGGREPPFKEAKRIAVTSLSAALPQSVKFDVV